MRLENRQQLDFDGLFRSEYPGIVREVHLMVGDADAARDVAREAFLRLLLHWRRIARHEPVSWVRRSAVRLAIRWGRARGAHKRALRELEQLIEGSGTSELSDEELQRAVLSLPGTQRAAVVLHDIAERTMVEVADALNRSEAKALGELERGRERLRHSVGPHGLLDEPLVLRLREITAAPVDVEDRLVEVRRSDRRRRRTNRAGVAMMAVVFIAVGAALTLNVWQPIEVWDAGAPPDPSALGLPDRLEEDFPLVAAQELPGSEADAGRATGALYRNDDAMVLVVRLADLHPSRYPDPVAQFLRRDAVLARTPAGMDVWTGEVTMGGRAWPAVARSAGDAGLRLIVGRDRPAAELVELADVFFEPATGARGWRKVREADVTRAFLGRPPFHLEGCSAAYSHPDGRQVYVAFWRDGHHVDVLRQWLDDPDIESEVDGKPAVAGSTPFPPFHSSVTWRAASGTTALVRITDPGLIPVRDTLELAYRLDRFVSGRGGSCLE